MPSLPIPDERFAFDAGKGEVSASFARPKGAVGLLVVAHGAGGGMDHPFLVGFTRALNSDGVATVRFNFPYMEARRRSPDPEHVAVTAWRAAFDVASARAKGLRVFAGGKSYGGRMASVAVAEGMDAAGLVFLGYPLHPPGRPERVRDQHLYGIDVPMLFLEGTRDPFADADLMARVLKELSDRATLHAVEGGDHSFNLPGTKRDAREVGASLAAPAAAFIREHA